MRLLPGPTVEFDGLGAIVIGNRGDGPVYVSDPRAYTGPFGGGARPRVPRGTGSFLTRT